jgi:hypothetical protein
MKGSISIAKHYDNVFSNEDLKNITVVHSRKIFSRCCTLLDSIIREITDFCCGVCPPVQDYWIRALYQLYTCLFSSQVNL